MVLFLKGRVNYIYVKLKGYGINVGTNMIGDDEFRLLLLSGRRRGVKMIAASGFF